MKPTNVCVTNETMGESARQSDSSETNRRLPGIHSVKTEERRNKNAGPIPQVFEVTPEIQNFVGVTLEDLTAFLLVESIKRFGPQKFKTFHESGVWGLTFFNGNRAYVRPVLTV